MTMARTSTEINEAIRACVALEELFNSRDSATPSAIALLAEIRSTLQIPESVPQNSKGSPNSGGIKRKHKSFSCVGVTVNPLTRTYVLPPKNLPSKKTDDESDESEHNENCEVCSQGGELLCCDTCSLVFHPACCRPELKSLPSHNKPWSCAFCVADGTVRGGYDMAAAMKYVEEMKLLGMASKPRYRGVVCKGIRFRAQIQISGKQINLGKYTTEIEAARKYDERARKAFGDRAKLNFPKPGELSHFDVPNETTSDSFRASSKKSPPSIESISTPLTQANTKPKSSKSSPLTVSSSSSSTSSFSKRSRSSSQEAPPSPSAPVDARKYRNSADQFLFNLEGNGATELDIDSSRGVHHTRHATSRRQVPAATVKNPVGRPKGSSPMISTLPTEEMISADPTKTKKKKTIKTNGLGEKFPAVPLEQALFFIQLLGHRALDIEELRSFDDLIATKNRQLLESMRDGLLAQLAAAETESQSEDATNRYEVPVAL